MAIRRKRVAAQVRGPKHQCHELTIAATGGKLLCQRLPPRAINLREGRPVTHLSLPDVGCRTSTISLQGYVGL